MPATIGYPKERIPRTKKNLELVQRARELLAAAQAYRQTFREAAWRQSEEQWKGHQWGEVPLVEGDLVTVNVSFSTVNTILPYVTGADPSFMVEPYGGKASPENARLIEAMLNRIWLSSRMSGGSHLRRAAWDYLLYGDGFLKASYTLDSVPKDGGFEEATVANLWVDRLDPYDVWLDPNSDGIHNSRYVIVRVFKSVEELQADKRYKNTGGLEADDPRVTEGSDPRAQITVQDTGDDRDKIVAIYEMYDLRGSQLVTWTDQSDLPLQVVEGITCPIVALTNHIIPKSPYHMGELEQILSLQQELNKTRTQMMEHRQRNAQKWMARQGALTADARQALESGEVNAVVEVAGDAQLSDIVMPLPVPNLSADVYQSDQIIKGDVYEVTGVNEYLRGGGGDIRRTATEATIIEGATNVKTAQKLRAIEEAARKIGQLLLDIAAAVYPLTDEDEMTLILTGRDAQAVLAAEGQPTDPAAVSGARLTPGAGLFEGSYEVFVVQGSTELRNPVLREQKYKEMFNMFMQYGQQLQQAGVQVNMRKITELWLDAAGVDDIDEILASAEAQPQAGEPQAPGGGLMAMGGGEGPMQPGPPTNLPSPENSGMLPPS